ncbi:IS66 family insertion sequence element accessory protein TnpB [Undibacterium sp. Ji50W]|uniref:IS66 family insertion sequence element accessory protein TnpB n=1 Tax=Undibacterium sp. Ji50W TaxID=3413041 RepID=UPI003BF448AC
MNSRMRKPSCDVRTYAFRNKNGNRIKLLVRDGTGVRLWVRRSLFNPLLLQLARQCASMHA